MQFSLLGILSVVLEVVRPYLWIVAVVGLIELGLIIRLRMRAGKLKVSRPTVRLAMKIAAVVGLLALVFAPSLTGASHASVQGWLDYTALVGIAIGVFVAAWLLLLVPVQLVQASSGTKID